MTTTVASVLSRVTTILQDSTNVRWSTSELVDWLNDGQREVVLFKPNAYTLHTALSLAIGTKQSLPADGVALIDVVRNMGVGGATAGPSIRLVSRQLLDAQVSDWHSATTSATIKHFVYDPLDPKIFYVYPPAATPTYVEIVYVATPANASNGGNITLDDIYVPALVNYILYRAYAKDAEFAAAKDLAAAYYATFQSLLGAKAGGEMAANPQQALAPMSPTVPGSDK